MNGFFMTRRELSLKSYADVSNEVPLLLYVCVCLLTKYTLIL